MSNAMRLVLGSPGVGMAQGMAPPTAAVSAPIVMHSPDGESSDLIHVQASVIVLALISVAALVLLNKAGFRFSVTVGG